MGKEQKSRDDCCGACVLSSVAVHVLTSHWQNGRNMAVRLMDRLGMLVGACGWLTQFAVCWGPSDKLLNTFQKQKHVYRL